MDEEQRKRVVLISAILGVVLLLGLAVWGAVWLLRDTATPEGEPPAVELPQVEEATPAPSATPVPFTEREAQNVGVTVRLQQEPEFQLTIESVEATAGRPTMQFYEPVPGAPYSLLRLRDTSGQIIAEHRFSVETRFIGEGPESDPQLINAGERIILLVAAVPEGSTVAQVEIVRQDGSPWDQQVLSLSSAAAHELLPLWSRLSQTWQAWFSPSAQASQGDGVFTILIINEIGGESVLTSAAAAAEQMLNIEPWKSFADADQVEIVVRINSAPLQCVGDQSGFPRCINDAAVFGAANQLYPDWDAIVVTTPIDCGCGTVGFNFPPITAIGNDPSVELVVHELGHAIGKMLDEYGYTLGGFTELDGPNCFNRERLCEQAIEPFAGNPAAQCSLGCDGTARWRPATRIMHNTYNPLEFGPLEHCEMHKQLAAAIGDEANPDCSTIKPTDPENFDEEQYWGWRR